ncbi:Motility protein B, N-terminal domain containing protein [Burkholderiaceae bacterium]
MMGGRSRSPRGDKDEAEKPFWISFADLMTALMVLFLVVMAVALLAVTSTVTDIDEKEKKHKADILQCMTIAATASRRHAGVKVDMQRQVIDFGDRARYAVNRADLSIEQQAVLRRFVPELLQMANTEGCKRVLKRIVVEGYTDKTGDYLVNLNLSLMRSQRVLCAMFETKGPDLLTEAQKEAVRDVFLVGGFAFNSSKATPEESRRVEMRLEFLGLNEERVKTSNTVRGNFGTCAI